MEKDRIVRVEIILCSGNEEAICMFEHIAENMLGSFSTGLDGLIDIDYFVTGKVDEEQYNIFYEANRVIRSDSIACLTVLHNKNYGPMYFFAATEHGYSYDRVCTDKKRESML